MVYKLLSTPREFFRDLHKTRNHGHVITLLVLAGIARAFDRAIGNSQGDKFDLETVILLAIISGALLGWLSFYIYAALVSWTSEWLGGSIATKHIVDILAYAAIPSIFSLVFIMLQIFIFGNEIFKSEESYLLNDADFLVFSVLVLLQLSFNIYSFALFIIGLSVVQKVGLGRALLNAIMPVPVIVAILIAVFFLGTLAS